MEDNNPMQALFEMYDAQVAEHDKAGYAQKFKDCTDLFFKDVGEHWHFEEAPIHFTDVEYLDGYFLFGMGTNSVIHFHVAECPGWKFAIWWETPEDKDDDDIITGQFFTQYEETIDKFKPSRSDMCIKIVMRLDVDEPYCEDYVDAANIINFIKAVISIDAELSPSRVRDEIEDGFSSYIDATDWEKQPFYDSVDTVLSASGYQYEIVHDNIPAVDTYRTLYI